MSGARWSVVMATHDAGRRYTSRDYALITTIRFQLDSTAVQRALDCLSEVIKVTATRNPVVAAFTLTYLFIEGPEHVDQAVT